MELSNIDKYVEESDIALFVWRGELMKTHKLFRIQQGVYMVRPKNLVEQVVEEAMLKEHVNVDKVYSFRKDGG